MKCKYTFPVKWRSRLKERLVIPARGWSYEFVADDITDVITHITVTVGIHEDHWPEVKHTPGGRVSATMDTKLVHLPFIKKELLAIQGAMSVFGLKAIDFNSLSIEWIPETADEDNKLAIRNFSAKREGVPDADTAYCDFDILARAVIASHRLMECEVPLNFFRRGELDIADDNYIEAIYDFYFILENQFGDGKFKQTAIKDSFSKSPQLRAAVEEAKNDVEYMDPRIRPKYISTYAHLSVDELIDRIIELRGFLHHHSAKRQQQNNWHPEAQESFRLDCELLHRISFKIVFSMIGRHLWDKHVVDEYNEIANSYNR